MTSVIYQRSTTSSLTVDTVRTYRRNIDPAKTSTAAPVGIVENHAIFVFRVTADTNSHYWRLDGYRWKNLRTTVKPQNEPTCRISTFQMIAENEKVDFFRTEYFPVGCVVKPPNTWRSPYVIVHYSGTFNLKNYVCLPHGNVKITPDKISARFLRDILGVSSTEVTPVKNNENLTVPTRPQPVARKRTGGISRTDFPKKRANTVSIPHSGKLEKSPAKDIRVSATNSTNDDMGAPAQESDDPGQHKPSAVTIEARTAAAERRGFERSHPSVKQNLLEKLNVNKTPSQAFREATREGITKHGRDKSSYLPRNRKQVYNIKQQMQEEHDDIYEVYLFAKQHEKIVVKLELIPNVRMILMHPEMNKHLNSLCQSVEPRVFHYDTTFNVGKFFTSILSLRHPVFKSEPLIPVAAMFHEATDEDSHQVFFQTVRRHLQLDIPGTVIVTDREKGITNAIKSNLASARNLYCWNHLRRNVGDWVKKNLTGNEVSNYKRAVFQLLQSESADDYMLKLANFQQEWDSRFQTYYEKNIEGSLKESYRPVLEALGIYNIISGITNNPAESANAAFKRITDHKSSTFFQALSHWYLYQVDSILDIYRGLESEGDFKPKLPIPSGLHAPVDYGDAVNPEVAKSIVYDGKLPPHLLTSKKYDASCVPNLTTQLGLAKLIIEKSRIKWLPQEAVFVVTGLMGQTFLVDLSKNKCTCLRKRSCEHLLAVQMATGVGKKFPHKRPRPNVGKLYRRRANATAGTKKGQAIKRRPGIKNLIALIKQKKPCNEERNDNEESDEEGYSLDTDIQEEDLISTDPLTGETNTATKIPVSLKDCVADISVDNSNYKKTFLHLPFGNITFAEMQTIKNIHTENEILLLEKALGSGTQNWMVDSVISGFLMRITDLKADGAVSVTVQESGHILREEDSSFIFAAGDVPGEDCHDWKQIQQILFPLNKGGDHWILLILHPHKREIEVFDPVGTYILPAKCLEILQTLFNPKFGYKDKAYWQVVYPQASRSLGFNALQCGPFVCYYAEASVSGWSLLEMPDVDVYRNHVAATILGNCSPGADNRKKKCYLCNELVPSKERCDFCQRKAHRLCLESIRVRGRNYHICK